MRNYILRSGMPKYLGAAAASNRLIILPRMEDNNAQD